MTARSESANLRCWLVSCFSVVGGRTLPPCASGFVDTWDQADSLNSHLQKRRVVTHFESWVDENLPALKTGGLYKINCDKALRFCRGLSVPRSSGQRGHIHLQTEPLPKGASPAVAPHNRRRRHPLRPFEVPV